MKTERMWRVLATHWELEAFTECFCRSEEEANRVYYALLEYDEDATVQVDPPKQKEGQ